MRSMANLKKNLHFDVLLLSIAYKVSAKKYSISDDTDE